MQVSEYRRDFIYLALLIIMIKVAASRRAQDHETSSTQNQSTETIALMQESPRMPEREEVALYEEDNETPFVVHEVDQHVLKQIDIAQEQIKTVLDFIEPAINEVAQLQSIKQQLIRLKRNYQHTSPAVSLLGPMGTMGVVLKEEKLERELLDVINKTSQIFHDLAAVLDIFTPSDSVAQALQTNYALLSQITAEKTDDLSDEIS